MVARKYSSVAALFCLTLGNALQGQSPTTTDPFGPPPLPSYHPSPIVKIDSEVEKAQAGFSAAGMPDFSQSVLAPQPSAIEPQWPQLGGPQASMANSQLFWLGMNFPMPMVLSELFDGGNQTVLIRNQVESNFAVQGQLLSGVPLDANSLVGFERQVNGAFGDFFSVPGTGSDASGDAQIDSFEITEPLPPNDSDTSPGPDFVFDGGRVVYVGNSGQESAQNGDPVNDDPTWRAFYSYSTKEEIALPGVGGIAVRRVKIAENNSPIPRNRFYLDYRFFNDVISGIGDVNRYTFGLEKTIANGLTSIDVRIPFAATLDSTQVEGGALARNTELGNVTFIFKDVLTQSRTLLTTWGIAFALPTGDDTRLYRSTGEQLLQINNRSIHLSPFLAAAWAPNQDYWVQGFYQFDFDLNGNPVAGDASGRSLPHLGTLQDSTWMLLDVSGGYWFYQSPCECTPLRKAALIAELHYNTTLTDADVVTGNGITVTDLSNRLDVLSATGGFHFQMRDNWTITSGVTVPMRDGDDKQFDYEVAVLVNSFF
ncbi:MAG: hypothetical protein R3C28_28710 [Pirellulaceae bacterium]